MHFDCSTIFSTQSANFNKLLVFSFSSIFIIIIIIIIIITIKRHCGMDWLLLFDFSARNII